jgi:hypothetical protein
LFVPLKEKRSKRTIPSYGNFTWTSNILGSWFLYGKKSMSVLLSTRNALQQNSWLKDTMFMCGLCGAGCFVVFGWTGPNPGLLFCVWMVMI